LDAVRFSAALVVFLGHLSGHRFTAGFLWPLGNFMDLAVIVFFVLSGYVIAYVVDDHEKTLTAYTVNRMARVFSVTIPALLITLLLDAIGKRLHPEMYSISWGFSDVNPWIQYLSALTFTNQIWWNNINPGSMLPYWSLGYEVWYYAIFAAMWFGRGSARYITTASLCLVAGPKIIYLFPLWLSGFGAYYFCKGRAVPRHLAVAIFFATSLIVACLFYLTIKTGLRLTNSTATRYVAALVFLVNIYAAHGIDGRASRFLIYIRRPVRWAAGMTFTLYLLHIPIAQFLTTILPWGPAAAATRLTILVGTLLVIIIIAALTERRKEVWRRAVTRIFSTFFKRLAPHRA
jgi:peptidoglycan/LPS O-acetylase OafA/YrhL